MRSCRLRHSSRFVFALAASVSLAAGQASATDKPTRDEVVAACLVLEAGGEGTDGMIAVANVIYNRAGGDAARFAEVVLKPRQFSCFSGQPAEAVVARAKRHPRWSLAAQLAESVAIGALEDVTGGADHYYADSIPSPRWARGMTATVRIGAHRFFRSRK